MRRERWGREHHGDGDRDGAGDEAGATGERALRRWSQGDGEIKPEIRQEQWGRKRQGDGAGDEAGAPERWSWRRLSDKER